MFLEVLGLPPRDRISKLPMVHVILPLECMWQCHDYLIRRMRQACREHLTLIVLCNMSLQSILKITCLRELLFGSDMVFQHFLQLCTSVLCPCGTAYPQKQDNSSILGNLDLPENHGVGCRYFSPMSEGNARQDGLLTELDQNPKLVTVYKSL